MPKFQMRNFCINKHDNSSVFKWQCVVGWVLRNMVLSSSESKSPWRWLENVGTHPGTQHCIPEDLNPQKECCQKLKSCNHKVHAYPHISTYKLTVYQQLTTFDQSISLNKILHDWPLFLCAKALCLMVLDVDFILLLWHWEYMNNIIQKTISNNWKRTKVSQFSFLWECSEEKWFLIRDLLFTLNFFTRSIWLTNIQ
jgi:hypothetical protein